MFQLAREISRHARTTITHRAVGLDTRQLVAMEVVPVPPAEVHIENPNASQCHVTPTPCKVGQDTSCIACREFGWVCINLSSNLIVDGGDGRVTFPPNETADDGWCLPPLDTRNQINKFTTDTLLTFNQDLQVWNYRTICKYPTIFSGLDDRSDCNIFHNPCEGSKLVRDDGSELTVPVSFDPFLNGRCMPATDRIPLWDVSNGPRTIPRTVGNTIDGATSCPPGYALSTSAIPGVRENVAGDLAAVAPICVPIPCQVDSVTGVVSTYNHWNPSYKCCTCDYTSGWVTAHEDFSGDGNYVDSPSGVNACRHVGDIFGALEEHAYVYPDGSSIFAVQYPDEDDYWYEIRYPEGLVKFPDPPEMQKCGDEATLGKPDNLAHSIVSEELQEALRVRANCIDASGNVVFNPLLANGRVAQANQGPPQIGNITDWSRIKPPWGAIRSNMLRYNRDGKMSGVPTATTTGRDNDVTRVCVVGNSGLQQCDTATDKLRTGWRVVIDPVSNIPDTKSSPFAGPTDDNLTTNRLISAGVSVVHEGPPDYGSLRWAL